MNDVNMKIDVSIITPSYNTSKFIEATIKSVLDQDFESWEMVIVDDNSSDRSPEIIKRYAAEDSRIILIENKENAGAAISRNLEGLLLFWIATIYGCQTSCPCKLISCLKIISGSLIQRMIKLMNRMNE